MSVFRGGITEYPGVVADNFSAMNVQRGRAFFLSHCHKDHMTGLDSPQLLAVLKGRSRKLYCSEVTRSLLYDNPFFENLKSFLNALPMNEPVAMTIEQPSTKAESPQLPLHFTVTLLPAGHCPGSTMFLFQGQNGNVLYTGDFRLTLEETKKLAPLRNGSSKVLDIRTLYLDTTFCHPIAAKIPSRDISRDCVLRIMEEWLGKSPTHVVHLKCAMFGYEHILMAVSQQFKTRVHIAAWRLAAYRHIPAVAQCLTLDGSTTRIHCCNHTRGERRRGRCGGLPCGAHRESELLVLKPSTMWFLGHTKKLAEPFVYLPQFNACRVLHSMHASYEELCSFVRYLSPKRLVPCVVPVGDRSLRDVHARLKVLLPQLEVVTDSGNLTDLPHKATLKSRSQGQKRRWRPARSPAASSSNDTDSECSSSSSSSSSSETDTDTIDEFPSSEEHSARTSSPSHVAVPSLPHHLSLPSMLTSTLTGFCAPPSSSSSPKALLAAPIEQTPLDLSVESTDSLTAASPCKEVSNSDHHCSFGGIQNGSSVSLVGDDVLLSSTALPCSISNSVSSQVRVNLEMAAGGSGGNQSREVSPADVGLPSSSCGGISSPLGSTELLADGGRAWEDSSDGLLVPVSCEQSLSNSEHSGGGGGGSIEELYISLDDSEASESCSTPAAKRMKTAGPGTSTPTSKQLDSVPLESVIFIDLTQDSPQSSSDPDVTLIEEDDGSSFDEAELSSTEDDLDSSGGVEIIEHSTAPPPSPTTTTAGTHRHTAPAEALSSPDIHQASSRHSFTDSAGPDLHDMHDSRPSPLEKPRPAPSQPQAQEKDDSRNVIIVLDPTPPSPTRSRGGSLLSGGEGGGELGSPPLPAVCGQSSLEEEEGGGAGGALGSPMYLPPTPGREAVDSILTRTSFL